MIKGFYDHAHHSEVLFHAAELVGTPFVAHAMIPGAGIDCVHVNAWVYLKTGFLQTFAEPKYTLQEGKHATISPLFRWLETSGKFARIDKSSPGIGDTLCLQFRQRCAFHTGLMLADNKFIHVLEHRRAEVVDLVGVYHTTLRAVYRPLKETNDVRH